jgi:hypothetical protein
MANKAKANPAKLVPLKEQAFNAICDAALAIETSTRQYSIRRRMAEAKLSQARAAFRAGNYVTAANTARNAQN